MRFLKRLCISVVAAAVCATLVYFVCIPVVSTLFMPGEVRLSREEVSKKQSISPNQYVLSAFDAPATDADGATHAQVSLKLFGIFPIKKINVEVMPFERVLAGGVPIGLVAKTDGVVTLMDAHGFRRGDVVTSVDNGAVTSVSDLERRLGKKNLSPYFKDDTSGIGTLTYINPADNNFAALGHMLVDYETGSSVNLRCGDVYACNLVGLEKSAGNRVGEMQNTLKKSLGVQGSIVSSNRNGIYGCLKEDSAILDACKNNSYPVRSRYGVKPGRAQVLVALDGENVTPYDCDIIKAKFQRGSSDKGLVVRITDERLLSATGGIVHGMSGSPIIQDGHLIGALTHVMGSDVTKGYGVYIDFVLP